MSISDTFLNKLKARQQEYALEALKRPNQRDAFEYGHRVGVIDGLEQAVNILLQLHEEEKNGRHDI